MRALVLALAVATLAGCGATTPRPERPSTNEPGSPETRPSSSVGRTQDGKATWYGGKFHGRKTASGERYNQNAFTAAHRTLPFGTRVRVTNTRNGRTVQVRINDRGPYGGRAIIDLSRAAARDLDMIQAGIVPVHLEILWTP
jgi:rare lipoprotein A